jgi:hypothetical protein
VKKLLALAFAPVLDVIKAFELIANDLNNNDGEKVLDYFEPMWIGEPKRRETGRKKGEFPIELSNVYDWICTDLPRSNNSIEGWHQAFARRVSIVHPTINKLADKIRRRYRPNSSRLRAEAEESGVS